MTRAVAQTPNDLVLSSTTEPQEALDHAVSENWKEPFIPAAEKKAAEEAELTKAKALLEAQETPEEKEEREAKEAEEAVAKEAAAREGETDEQKAAREKEEREQPSGKGGFSKRINKLTARNARITEELQQERTKREELERRLSALERGDKPGLVTAELLNVADLPNKPKRIDFKDEETYVEKLIQWTRANEDYKEGVQAEQEHVKEVFKASRERIAEARERIDDWDEVAKSALDMIFPFSVTFAIDEMSNSADVLYHIAKHPEVYAKMSKMSPNQMIVEAGRISDKLIGAVRTPANGNGNGSRKPRPQVAEPITPGGRRTTAQGKKLEDMNADEYIAARRTMRAARRAN